MATRQKPSGEPAKKRKKYPADHTVGEFRSSAKVGTAIVPGVTFRNKALQYAEVDGIAIFEGDIELGTVEQVRQQADAVRAAQDPSGQIAHGVVISGQNFRWPNCQVPYEIDPALPDQARVTDAIAHWEANTRFRFILRTAANQAQFPDYVTFAPGNGCSAAVGRRGGQQFIRLAGGCSTGNTIHEIGHAVGLWHEQSREDRDNFVTIQWANIIAGFEHNFNQHIADGDDVGVYDYGSIMHYPRDAFSANGQDTIVPTQAGVQIGQRTGLSAGDIAAANSLCPIATLKFADDIATLKFFDDPRPTLKFLDDPRPTLKFFDDPGPTLKFLDDPRTLKFTDDPQPTLKFSDDPRPTLKFSDDPQPTLKFRDDIVGQPVKGPGSDAPAAGAAQAPAAPFVLATPHHSMAWTQSYPEAYQAQIAELERQLNELYGALAQAGEADQRGALSGEERAQVDALYQEFQALANEYQALTGVNPL